MGRKMKRVGLWPAPPCPGVKPATAVCCEVMAGAAWVLLQVETDSGRAGWRPQPWRSCRENHTMTGWLPVPQPHSPARPWGGAHGPVGILASPGPRASSTAGIEFRGEPWQDAKGKAWPPPVSEPLCPGVVDLPRQVQKAPERNQLELEPGIQPPGLPRPSPTLAAAASSFS